NPSVNVVPVTDLLLRPSMSTWYAVIGGPLFTGGVQLTVIDPREVLSSAPGAWTSVTGSGRSVACPPVEASGPRSATPPQAPTKAQPSRTPPSRPVARTSPPARKDSHREISATRTA